MDQRLQSRRTSTTENFCLRAVVRRNDPRRRKFSTTGPVIESGDHAHRIAGRSLSLYAIERADDCVPEEQPRHQARNRIAGQAEINGLPDSPTSAGFPGFTAIFRHSNDEPFAAIAEAEWSSSPTEAPPVVTTRSKVAARSPSRRAIASALSGSRPPSCGSSPARRASAISIGKLES